MSTLSSARKPRGRPKVDATPVNTRFPPEELAALDAYIAAQPEPLTRPEAIRRILRGALTPD